MMVFFSCMQPGTAIENMIKMKTFPEPRLLLFGSENNLKDAQGFIVAEKQILFEVDEFNLVDGLISLIASYYVFYVS